MSLTKRPDRLALAISWCAAAIRALSPFFVAILVGINLGTALQFSIPAIFLLSGFLGVCIFWGTMVSWREGILHGFMRAKELFVGIPAAFQNSEPLPEYIKKRFLHAIHTPEGPWNKKIQFWGVTLFAACLPIAEGMVAFWTSSMMFGSLATLGVIIPMPAIYTLATVTCLAVTWSSLGRTVPCFRSEFLPEPLPSMTDDDYMAYQRALERQTKGAATEEEIEACLHWGKTFLALAPDRQDALRGLAAKQIKTIEVVAEALTTVTPQPS